MECVNVINLDKYNPGYKDREVIWIKVYLNMMTFSYGFDMLHEIDKWRFIALCMLQIKMKKPVPIDCTFLSRRGMVFKHRKLQTTINSLKNAELVEVISVTQTQTAVENSVKSCNVEKRREDKNRIEINETNININSLVNITIEQFNTLTSMYGEETVREYAERIKDYCDASGKKYKDYSAVIRQWIRRDKDNGKFKRKSDALAKMEERYGANR